MNDKIKDSEYLENLFNEYIPTLGAMNEVTVSFYSKDEFKLRHRIFKHIYGKYKRYKIKLMIEKFKNKFFKFKQNITERKVKRIVNQYNKLKENGEFLPKIKD